MIATGSLVGFLLVFVAVTWVLSLALYCGLAHFRRRLRRVGPRVERTAAALAIILPPLFGAAVTASLIRYSVASVSAGLDHCEFHGRHLHLCLVHGGAWLGKSWAVALVSVTFVVIAARLTRQWASLWIGRTHLQQVARVSKLSAQGCGATVLLAPSRRLFCFVGGLWSPRIYASTSAKERLTADKWHAMIAHERAHIEHGDLWREALLRALAIAGAPVVSGRALQVWRSATERLCDLVAARSTGDASNVASALLAMSSAGQTHARCSFTPRADTLADRVSAVLDETADGAAGARRLSIAMLAAYAVGVGLVVVLAGPLHHTMETLLGLV